MPSAAAAPPVAAGPFAEVIKKPCSSNDFGAAEGPGANVTSMGELCWSQRVTTSGPEAGDEADAGEEGDCAGEGW